MKSFILSVALCVLSITLHSTTFTVTNTNDDGDGSLRAALTAAFAEFGASHIINIELDPGSIITISTIDAIIGDIPVSALPRLTNTVFNGNGVVIKANGNVGRFFQVEDCTLNDLIFDGGMGHTTGGSLFLSGTNEINRCMILNSLAGVANPGAGAGGAIRIQGGTTTFNECTLRNNMSSKGSAIWIQAGATAFINNSTIVDNTVVPSTQGVIAASIFLEGTLHMTGNIIANSLPEGSVDLYDSGNTIETNVGNLIERFVCGGTSCQGETFASTEDPGLVPTDPSDPYFIFNVPAGSPASVIGAGATTGPTGTAIQTIPTMGEWGIICLALIFMTIGVVSMRERQLEFA